MSPPRRGVVPIDLEVLRRKGVATLPRWPIAVCASSRQWPLGANVQADVVALSWREKAILHDECKWGVDAMPRPIVTKHIEDKTPTPRLLAELLEGDEAWRVYYAFFTGVGLTPAAPTLAAEHDAQIVIFRNWTKT